MLIISLSHKSLKIVGEWTTTVVVLQDNIPKITIAGKTNRKMLSRNNLVVSTETDYTDCTGNSSTSSFIFNRKSIVLNCGGFHLNDLSQVFLT